MRERFSPPLPPGKGMGKEHLGSIRNAILQVAPAESEQDSQPETRRGWAAAECSAQMLPLARRWCWVECFFFSTQPLWCSVDWRGTSLSVHPAEKRPVGWVTSTRRLPHYMGWPWFWKGLAGADPTLINLWPQLWNLLGIGREHAASWKGNGDGGFTRQLDSQPLLPVSILSQASTEAVSTGVFQWSMLATECGLCSLWQNISWSFWPLCAFFDSCPREKKWLSKFHKLLNEVQSTLHPQTTIQPMPTGYQWAVMVVLPQRMRLAWWCYSTTPTQLPL